MSNEQGLTVINRKRGPVSTLIWGVTAVVLVVTVTGCVIVLYVVFRADRYIDRVLKLAESPDAIIQAIPVLHDALDDRRDVGYGDRLEVKARLMPVTTCRGHSDEAQQVVMEVKNKGDAVVTMLGVRVAVLDGSRNVLWDGQTEAALPLAFDCQKRGPLWPGSLRIFRMSPPVRLAGAEGKQEAGSPTIEWEVTELRVWNGPRRETGAALVGKPAAETRP